MKTNPIKWDLVFSTYSGKGEHICISTNFDISLLTLLSSLPSFIKFYTNGIKIYIAGEDFEFDKFIRYLIIFKYEQNPNPYLQSFINSIIRVIYQYFSPIKFSDMIAYGILNRNSFLYHEVNTSSTNRVYFDKIDSVVPFKTLFDEMGELIFDLMNVYYMYNLKILISSIRDVFVYNKSESVKEAIFEKFAKDYNFDLKNNLHYYVWREKYIEDDNIDEIIETTEESI